ncbi:hypothetical protein Hanom_Chr17g01529241 [Helianthus anomalus]
MQIMLNSFIGTSAIAVGEKLGVPCDPSSTPIIAIIFCGIQEGEYGWRRFVLDRRRGFTDYSTAVPSGGWGSGFRAS